MAKRRRGILGEQNDHRPTGHLVAALAAIAVITACGVAGYLALTEMTPFEALYMTVTTLSTVGFQEVHPLDPRARAFTIALIVAGVGTALYTAGALAEFLIAGRLRDVLGRRAMSRTLAALRDHVIVCGYGRLGQAVADELLGAGVPLIVVEEDAAVFERLEDAPFPVIRASAADDDVLIQAGVDRTRGLVVATGSEAVNVFVTLAAREVNPTVAIHARAESEAGARRLRGAGANQVISPYQLAGRRLAHSIIRPAVVDFVEIATSGRGAPVDLEEVAIASGSRVAGRRLRELRDLGLRISVVAIQRESAPLALNPEPDAELRPGDHVVVAGDRENLDRLADLATAR